MTPERRRLLAYLGVVATAAVLLARGESTRTNDNRHNREAIQRTVSGGQKARRETCRYVDAAQNRDRARIIEGERQLYGPFRDLFPNLTDQQIRQIHAQNRKNYNEVIQTRPSYCPPHKRIRPYPSLRQQMKPPPKRKSAQARASPRQGPTPRKPLDRVSRPQSRPPATINPPRRPIGVPPPRQPGPSQPPPGPPAPSQQPSLPREPGPPPVVLKPLCERLPTLPICPR